MTLITTELNSLLILLNDCPCQACKLALASVRYSLGAMPEREYAQMHREIHGNTCTVTDPESGEKVSGYRLVLTMKPFDHKDW